MRVRVPVLPRDAPHRSGSVRQGHEGPGGPLRGERVRQLAAGQTRKGVTWTLLPVSLQWKALLASVSLLPSSCASAAASDVGFTPTSVRTLEVPSQNTRPARCASRTHPIRNSSTHLPQRRSRRGHHARSNEVPTGAALRPPEDPPSPACCPAPALPVRPSLETSGTIEPYVGMDGMNSHAPLRVPRGSESGMPDRETRPPVPPLSGAVPSPLSTRPSSASAPRASLSGASSGGGTSLPSHT